MKMKGKYSDFLLLSLLTDWGNENSRKSKSLDSSFSAASSFSSNRVYFSILVGDGRAISFTSFLSLNHILGARILSSFLCSLTKILKIVGEFVIPPLLHFLLDMGVKKINLAFCYENQHETLISVSWCVLVYALWGFRILFSLWLKCSALLLLVEGTKGVELFKLVVIIL